MRSFAFKKKPTFRLRSPASGSLHSSALQKANVAVAAVEKTQALHSCLPETPLCPNGQPPASQGRVPTFLAPRVCLFFPQYGYFIGLMYIL